MFEQGKMGLRNFNILLILKKTQNENSDKICFIILLCDQGKKTNNKDYFVHIFQNWMLKMNSNIVFVWIFQAQTKKFGLNTNPN